MQRRTIRALLESWELHLRAANLSPRTIDSYLLAGRQLADSLDEHGHSGIATEIDRDDVRRFLAHISDTRAAATAAQRYASLKQLFKWLLAEDEIDTDPMDGIAKPKLEEKPIPVLTEDQLKALLAACSPTGLDGQAEYEAFRDTAIMQLFISTPMRLSELTDRKVDDLDLAGGTLRIVAKGRRERHIRFGNEAAKALDRYLRRARPYMQGAESDWLWLGYKGRLGTSGVGQMVKRRAEQAGIGHVHPHQFRHTFAHRWLKEGGSEGGLQKLAGWKDRQMLARYASAEAERRAIEEHERLGIGDNL